MATTAYLVTLAANAQGQVLQGGANAVVVAANSSTEAKQMAAAALGFDGLDAVWLGSSEVTVTAIAAATDWADPITWNFRIIVSNPTTLADVVDVTVQSDSTNDTIDEIAALLVTALNATTPIAGAAYNSTSQVLTIAETTDVLGDHNVVVYAWPNIDGGDQDGPRNVGTFFGAVTDGGMASAALSVTLGADALAVPKVYGSFKQVALSL